MFENDRGIRVGTSSWSSKDWVGVFYPPKTPSNRFIEHYSTVYDTVEIDSTFYGIPSEQTVRSWRERTPEGFRFAAKVPRTVTHEKVLVDAAGDMNEFLETMTHLEDRIGPFLLQFPYFRKDVFPTRDAFLERLDGFLAELPREFRYVVEVRNPNWLGPALQEVCRQRGVCLAWAAQSWMPPARVWSQRLGGVSTNFAYLRFLGDHKGIEKITKTWEKTVVDRSDELNSWIPIVRGFRAEGVNTFIFFNNHFSGHAPETIETFRDLWRQALAEGPDAG